MSLRVEDWVVPVERQRLFNWTYVDLIGTHSRKTKEVLVCCGLGPFLCFFLAQVMPCLLAINISKSPPRRVRLLVAELTRNHLDV